LLSKASRKVIFFSMARTTILVFVMHLFNFMHKYRKVFI